MKTSVFESLSQSSEEAAKAAQARAAIEQQAKALLAECKDRIDKLNRLQWEIRQGFLKIDELKDSMVEAKEIVLNTLGDTYTPGLTPGYAQRAALNLLAIQVVKEAVDTRLKTFNDDRAAFIAWATENQIPAEHLAGVPTIDAEGKLI